MGEILSVEGGIEMKYVTPPVICFAKLEYDELDWFNAPTTREGAFAIPLLRSPIVSYRSVREGWQITRLNPACHAGPYPIDAAHGVDPSRRMRVLQKDSIFLRIFVAAAAVGDVTALYSAFYPAKDYCIRQKLEGVFCQAARKLLGQLIQLILSNDTDDGDVIPPHQLLFAKRQESFFLNEMGAVYESQASWLGRRTGQEAAATAALQSAARCYFQAAKRTHEFVPNRKMRFDLYCNLGVALFRLGYSEEMVKRAYLWALTDPFSWKEHYAKPGGGRIDCDLCAWWDACHGGKDYDELRKMHQKAMKAQRAGYKNAFSNSNFYEVECHSCKTKIKETRLSEKRCARCLIAYCSEDCYRKDWPQHKKTCKQVAPAAVNDDNSNEETKDDASLMYDKYGRCIESTRERLALWTNTKYFTSLSARTKRVEMWKRSMTRPTILSFTIPLWFGAIMNSSTPGATEVVDDWTRTTFQISLP
jgi:MYND finger